jgi:hypothetical protein
MYDLVMNRIWHVTYRKLDQETGFVDKFDQNVVEANNACCHFDVGS